MDHIEMLILIGVGGLLVLIFGIISIVMLVKHFRDKKKIVESDNWASVQGQIIFSDIRRQDSINAEGHQNVSYVPEVRYRYEHLGTEYTNDKISFGGKIGRTVKGANTILARYPVGENVTVFYNPANPADSVLERRVGSSVFLWVGLLFVFLTLAVIAVGGVLAMFSFAV